MATSALLFYWAPNELAQPSRSQSPAGNDLFLYDHLWGAETVSTTSVPEPFWASLDIYMNRTQEEMGAPHYADTVELREMGIDQDVDARQETDQHGLRMTNHTVQSSLLADEERAFGPGANQEGGAEMDLSLATADEGVKNPTLLGEDGDDAAQYVPTVSSLTPSQSPLLEELRTTSPSVEPVICPKNMPEDLEGDTEELAELGYARDASPDHDGGVWPTEGAASMQAIRVERRLGERSPDKHAPQDFPLTAPRCELVHNYDTDSEKPSIQGAGKDGLLEQDGPILHELRASVTAEQAFEHEVAAAKGSDPESATAANGVGLEDGESAQQHVCDVWEGPGMCGDEAEDGAARSEGLVTKAEAGRESRAKPLSVGPRGSKSNPVVVDDDDNDDDNYESRSQSPFQSIDVVFVSDGSSSNGRVVGRLPCRSRRQEHKRKLGDMELWGSADFRKQQLAERQSHWRRVKEYWIGLEATLPKLRDQDQQPQRSLTAFYAGFYSLWAASEESHSISAAKVLEVIHLWKKAQEGLETGGASMCGKEKEGVLGFEQAMDLLCDTAALCDSIEAYPSSLDSKDERWDANYNHTQRRRRRRNGDVSTARRS